MDNFKIKISSNSGTDKWIKQFPNEKSLIWNNCKFTLDSCDNDYDWLVVIDKTSTLQLNCPPENTIFVATEPSTISYYGQSFVSQFSYLITNQNAKSLPHMNAIRTQPGNHWFYEKPYRKMAKEPPHKKTKLLSVIATHRSEKHTAHRKRYDFIKEIANDLPEADILFSRENLAKDFYDIFANRAKFVPNKYNMIDDYKYHLAIGNQAGDNILTERISDSFLGYAIPISWGCTNLSHYFPEDSFIEIDIDKPNESIEKIKNIVKNRNDYERRLPAVIEARRRVMEEYNLIAMIAEIVNNHKEKETKMNKRENIYSRRIMRITNLTDLLGFVRFRLKNFLLDISL